MLFQESRAEAVFHWFTAAAYFTPLIGGYISDRFWGKYRTIITLSWAYVAGHAVLEHGRLHLRGLVASVDGATVLREEGSAAPDDFQRLGVTVADGLLRQGAGEILRAVYADAR